MKIREGSAPDFQELQKQKAVEDIFGITQQEQTDFANITLASPEAIRFTDSSKLFQNALNCPDFLASVKIAMVLSISSLVMLPLSP